MTSDVVSLAHYNLLKYFVSVAENNECGSNDEDAASNLGTKE